MATEKTKQTTLAAPKKLERLIFLGPNIATYGLAKYAIYKGGLPVKLATEAFEKYPLLKLLFVSPARLGETEKAIKTNGTLQNEAYKQITKRGED